MGPWKKNTKMTISCTLVLALVLLVLGARGEVAQNSAQSLECTPEGRPKVFLVISFFLLNLDKSKTFSWTRINLKLSVCCGCEVH